jgi:hypothetical protein
MTYRIALNQIQLEQLSLGSGYKASIKTALLGKPAVAPDGGTL